jgi:hypothetical protein
VLADGVTEGRRIFANTLKDVLMGTSSNIGNIFSAAGASLFLSFLPMLPSQIPARRAAAVGVENWVTSCDLQVLVDVRGSKTRLLALTCCFRRHARTRVTAEPHGSAVLAGQEPPPSSKARVTATRWVRRVVAVFVMRRSTCFSTVRGDTWR